jgi:protein O-GlcNAc transferase
MVGVAQALQIAMDLHRGGRLEEAAVLYDRILDADRAHADAWRLSGMLALHAGRPADAVPRLRRAAALFPGAADCWAQLAAASEALQQHRAFIAAARRAVRLDPATATAETCYKLACAFEDLGDMAGADAASRRCGALAPNSAFLLFLRAGWDGRAYRLTRAAQGYARASALTPDRSEILVSLGATLLELGDAPGAETALRQVRRQAPDYWQALSSLLFVLCFKEGADPAEVFAEFRSFDALFCPPPSPVALPPAAPCDRDKRLKVGYVSPNFYGHPCGHFVLPVVEAHDKEKFAVHCYSTNPTRDAWTEVFQAHAERFIPCHHLNDDGLEAAIRQDGIDILVECSGHMAGHRLFVFARKPAPIQVGYPLFPNTTGLSAIDYRIMDRHFGPPWADDYHSEKLVRLPDGHVVYRAKPGGGAPPARPPMLTAGFPRFGSFNAMAKLGERTVAAWAEILRRAPTARLLLKWRGLADPQAAAAAGARFARHGVDEGRIEIAGWSDDPYAPYYTVDLALDPLESNGGTTTCDALWAGTPVLSCVGRGHFARVGLCHMTNVGLPELLTYDVDSYIAAAVRLVGDADELARIRHGLRERTAASPVMDAPRYVRHLEYAYREMWRRRCDGLPPAAFDVPLLSD